MATKKYVPAVDEDGAQIPGLWVWLGKNGRKTYVIREQVNGERYDCSTGKHKLREALDELDLFRKDPAAYKRGETPGQVAERPPIYLTAALVSEYLDYCRQPKTNKDGAAGAENSDGWVGRKKNLLDWWMDKLRDGRGKSMDLRRVPREFFSDIIDGRRSQTKADTWEVPPATDRRSKKNVIKGFYSWLVEVKRLLTRAEDPVADLPIGPGRSSITDAGIPKDKVPREHIKKVIALGRDQGTLYAHILTVQAGTSWHNTEMHRFVAGGAIEPLPEGSEQSQDGGPEVVAVLYCPKHKNGKEHRTPVTQNVLDSAQVILNQKNRPHVCMVEGCRLPTRARHLCGKHYQQWQAGSLSCAGDAGKEMGRSGWYRGRGKESMGFSIRNYERWMNECCAILGIPVFFGSWMRHTNATLAKNRHYDDAVVNVAQGRAADSAMMKKHYAPNAVPAKVPTVMDLAPKVAAKPPTLRKVSADPVLAERLKEQREEHEVRSLRQQLGEAKQAAAAARQETQENADVVAQLEGVLAALRKKKT